MASILNLFKKSRNEIPDVRAFEEPGSIQTKKYMGILDTYGVSWSLEKAARDTLQNFFDGNNHTLDGVDILVDKDGIFGSYTIKMQNHATYDFRRLLHLGGTTKADESFSAGGIGEGAKILALVLLRDYGFSQVRFGSQDWLVDFVMDYVPDGEYVEKRKGLFACVNPATEHIQGNLVEFKTKSKSYAEVFRDAKDLFYHPGNSDFKNPTLDIPKVGGFKFLGDKKTDLRYIPNGNFYLAGQRRHVGEEKWNNVEYVSIWTYGNNALRRDRDRGLITKKELIENIIPVILSSASVDDLKRVIYELEPIWTEGSGYKDLIGPKIMENIAEKLSEKSVRLEFNEKYLARHFSTFGCIEDLMASKGYVLCNSELSKIGMKSVPEKFRELQEHYRVEPSEKENKRINILYEAVAQLGGRGRKEIWIYDEDAEKSIFEGQYGGNFIWLSRQVLRSSFKKALADYLHELEHKSGTETDIKFNRALTDTIEDVIDAAIKQPEIYKTLSESWNRI